MNQVSPFKYLGSLVKEHGMCDADIKARIGMANTAFGQLRKILISLTINVRTKIRVLKAYVLSVLLFGCEAWTISKEVRERAGGNRNGLERDCLLGMIEGERARGRQRTKLMDGFNEVFGC